MYSDEIAKMSDFEILIEIYIRLQTKTYISVSLWYKFNNIAK